MSGFWFRLLLVGGGFLILPELCGLDLSGARFSDFRIRDLGDEQGGGWELHGGEAVVRGEIIEITGLQVKLSRVDGGIATIFSPQCTFDRSSQIGKSSESVRAVDQRMTIEAVGYHFLLDRQLIRLHSKVRMVIEQTGESLFPVSQPGQPGDRPKLN